MASYCAYPETLAATSKMMNNKFFWLPILLIFCGCIGDPNLNGHWHIKSINPEEKIMGSKFFTIDVFDNKATLNKSVFRGPDFNGWVHFNTGEINFGGECLILNFTFEKQGDNLLLYQSEYSKDKKFEFIGKKCDKNCCDLQEDFFSSTDLYIDLPEIIDTLNLQDANVIHQYSVIPLLFGGQDNNKSTDEFSFFMDKTEINSDSILVKFEEKNQMKLPERMRKRVSRIIFADKETPIKFIRESIRNYSKMKVQGFYIATKRKSIEEKFNYWLKRITLDELISDLSELDDSMKWKEYLSGKLN